MDLGRAIQEGFGGFDVMLGGWRELEEHLFWIIQKKSIQFIGGMQKRPLESVVQEIADIVLISGLRVEQLADRYLTAKARKAGKIGASGAQDATLGGNHEKNEANSLKNGTKRERAELLGSESRFVPGLVGHEHEKLDKNDIYKMMLGQKNESLDKSSQSKDKTDFQILKSLFNKLQSNA